MQVPRDGLVAKLGRLTASQQSIESVSAFCIFYHKDARGVAQIWDGEFYKAPAERRLALLYLANHILQEGRKHGTGFQDEFFKVLPKAMQHMVKTTQDDKTRRSVLRLVSVWEERRVFGSQHIKSFRSLLNGSGAAGSAGGSDTSSRGQPKSHAAARGAVVADAVTAAHKAAEAAVDATRKYHIGWKQEVLSNGSIEALSAALELVRARVGAIQAEASARRHATEVLKAELAKQEAAIAAAEEQLPVLLGQQGQGEQRLGMLANQAATAAAAAQQAQQNGDGPGVSGGDAGGSPEAPAMETDDDELAGLAEPVQNNDSSGALLANALAAIPDSQRGQMGTDLQQLLASGTLAQAIQSMGGAGAAGGLGGQLAFQGLAAQQAAAAGDDDAPYDPEYPD